MALIGARRPPVIGGVPMAIGAEAVPALGYPPTDVPDVPIAPKKQGINWLGVLADALSGAAGQPGMYAQRMYQQQHDQTDFERGEQQYQRHHSQDLADQMQLLDYKRLHPDDPLTQALDQAGITDLAERQKYYKADVERRTAPPMMSASGVDEQGNPVMRFFPRATAVNTSPGAPAVGTIRNGYRFKGGNPADQNAWEPVGGPTPGASGTFP